MNELKNFSEEEIIKRKEMFLERMDNLMKNISEYLRYPDMELEYRIKEEYKELKNEIQEDAKYLKTRRNDISQISKSHLAYSEGIREASAFGFGVKTNAAVNEKMIYAVEEAHYRLNKYFYM